ncbi:MAG: hypothetical protein V1766_15940 [Pseudomonadota bacterium]
MANMHKIKILVGLSVIVLGIMGCYSGGGAGATLQQGGNLIFQRVAIAPFLQMTPEQLDINAADCSRCRFFTRIDGSSDRPEVIVEQIFIERLKAGYKIDIIHPDRVAGIYERYVGAFDKVTPLTLLKKVGDDLDADGVVFGYVYRFRERQGTPYAAAKPASVAFEIYLFRVSDSALVWKGHFEKTQTSLMENVLQASAFLKGGGRWVTVSELSKEGIDNVMKNFPAPSK